MRCPFHAVPENLILAQAQWPGMLTRYNYDDAYRLTAATRGMIAGQVDGDQDDRRHEDHHERSWSLGDKDRLQHPDWISSGWEHGWREPDGHDGKSDRAGKGGRDDHDPHSHWPSGPEDLGNYHYTYDAAGNLTAVGNIGVRSSQIHIAWRALLIYARSVSCCSREPDPRTGPVARHAHALQLRRRLPPNRRHAWHDCRAGRW